MFISYYTIRVHIVQLFFSILKKKNNNNNRNLLCKYNVPKIQRKLSLLKNRSKKYSHYFVRNIGLVVIHTLQYLLFGFNSKTI